MSTFQSTSKKILIYTDKDQQEEISVEMGPPGQMYGYSWLKVEVSDHEDRG